MGLGIKVKKIKWGLYAVQTRNVSFLQVNWNLHRRWGNCPVWNTSSDTTIKKHTI